MMDNLLLSKESALINIEVISAKNEKLVVVLFVCILLNLIPVLLITGIGPGVFGGVLYGLLVGSIFLVALFILSVYYLKFTKMSVNRWLVAFACLFAASQAFTLVTVSLAGNAINNLDILNIAARFLCVVFFLCIPAGVCISKKGLGAFMSLIVVLGTVACIYNMVINFRGIMNILAVHEPYAVDFKSFYANRNSFAQLLFFSTVANTYLLTCNNFLMNWLLYPVIGLNLIATISRTAIASVIIFGMTFVFLHSREKIKLLIVSSITAGLLFLFINANKEAANFIKNILIREDIGTASRIDLWILGLSTFDHWKWIFGLGYLSSVNIVRSAGYNFRNAGFDSHEFHNFYVETLIGGGVVDLVLFAIVFSFIIYKVKNIYEKDRNTGILYISSFFGLLFYAGFESISFFSLGYVSSLFTIFFITVPLLYANGLSK